jgi:hypothetical protein
MEEVLELELVQLAVAVIVGDGPAPVIPRLHLPAWGQFYDTG